jgi:hypothetical protein
MVDWRLTAKSLFVRASYRVGALWRSVEARVEERFVGRTAYAKRGECCGRRWWRRWPSGDADHRLQRPHELCNSKLLPCVLVLPALTATTPKTEAVERHRVQTATEISWRRCETFLEEATLGLFKAYKPTKLMAKINPIFNLTTTNA